MCKHPLMRYPTIEAGTDKVSWKVSKYNPDFFTEDAKKVNLLHYGALPMQIPCGKCEECRLNYSRQWTGRNMLELANHASSYFITLTYNPESADKYLIRNGFDEKYGEQTTSYTLLKSDFQGFIKRLRKKISDNIKANNQLYPAISGSEPHIKYYMCGEYGEHSFRPHYHAIIYGLQLNDLVFYKKTKLGDLLYNSPFLESLWVKRDDVEFPEQLGFVVIGSVTPESVSYVSRYTEKKAHRDMKLFFEARNILPEYTSMSTRPAIGKEYFEANKHKILNSDYTSISTKKGGYKIYWSRYFKKKLEQEFPNQIISKSKRSIDAMDYLQKLKLSKTSKGYLEMLEDEEENLLARTVSLRSTRNSI